MPSSSRESKTSANQKLDQLRRDAEERLERSGAPQTNDWSLGSDTLTLLYQLASNPDTASDALKLLHELQVHQVELDLQHGQLKAGEDEAARALSLYQTFYEFAPIAYFALSLDGVIVETNRAGAGMFDIDKEDLHNQPVVNFLAPASRAEVISLLDRLRAGTTEATCEVQSNTGANGPQTLLLSASVPPQYEIVLLVVTVLA